MKRKTWKKAMRLVVCLLIVQLVIGATTVAAAPPAYGPVYHYVRWGETLYSIGRLYGVSPYTIAQANGIENPNCIYAGQTLLIPTACSYSCYHPCYCYDPCYTPVYPSPYRW